MKSPLTRHPIEPPVDRPTGPDTSPAPAGKARRRLTTLLLVAAIVVVGVAVARVVVDRLSPHLYAGTVLQFDEPAPPLDGLAYAGGEPVELAAFDDEVALVFFGYTNCPDVCPGTLSTVDRALDRLDQNDRDRVTMLMVSVDPDRDDLPSLQQYVEFFDPGFRGVGGPQPDIDRAASLYGVYYELDAPTPGGEYLVDHTASLMGIGPDGSLRVIWSSDVTAEALAADLAELLP